MTTTPLYARFGDSVAPQYWLPPVRVAVRRATPFAGAGKLIPLLVLVLLAGGCQSTQSVADEGRQSLEKLVEQKVAAAEQLTVIRDFVGTLAKSADPAVEAIADAMGKLVDRARDNVASMGATITKLGTSFETMRVRATVAEAEAADMKTWWIGYRTWQVWFWLKIAFWSILAIVVFVPGAGPIAAKVGGFLWRLLSYPASMIGAFLTRKPA